MYQKWRDNREYAKILEYVESLPDDEIEFEDRYQVIFALNRLNEFQKSKTIAKDNIHLLEGQSAIEQLKYHYELLMVYYRSGNYSDRIAHLRITKKIHDQIAYESLDDNLKTRYMSYFNHAGIFNYAKKNYSEAIENYEKLIQYGKAKGSKISILTGTINRSLILEYFGRYSEAIDAYLGVKDLPDELNRDTLKLTLYNNLVIAYQKSGRLAESLE